MAAVDGRAMFVVPEWIARHDVIPDGFRKGAPFRLYDYQLGYILNFYTVRRDAVWDPANPQLAAAFVYRRGLLVGPQKVGKNPMIAAQVTVEAVGPALFAGWAGKDEGYVCAEHGCGCGWSYAYDVGEPRGMSWPTPLIQITAFSEDSTENTYDALRPMIDEGPLHDVIPKTGEEFIRLPGGGRIDTVTSSNQSRLGQRVTFVPQDELGLWTAANRMIKLADTQYRGLAGMGGRASLTTNAWDPAEHSVAQREFESKADDIYRQFVEPPKHLSYANQVERRKIHLAVYPFDVLRDNGGHVELDSIEAEAADLAQKDPAQAERFFGNRCVAGFGAAVEAPRWADLFRQVEVAPGTYIGLGFDGSLSEDATVLRACTADGYGFSLPGWAWVRPVGPEMAKWQLAHPGKEWEVPRAEVNLAVADAFARFRVGRMLCDPAYWRDSITRWASMYGDEVVLAFDTNSANRMAAAFDRWKTAIKTGDHTHDGDPEVTAHVEALHQRKARNAAPDDDGRTPVVPVKGDDRRKIDGALADILAYEAAMTMPPPRPRLPPPTIPTAMGF
jgi:hypothetical protein